MTDRELLEQALKELEGRETIFKERNINKVIEAIRTRLAQPEPVQVSIKEFLAVIKDKEEFVGTPMMWAEWPEREKNNA